MHRLVFSVYIHRVVTSSGVCYSYSMSQFFSAWAHVHVAVVKVDIRSVFEYVCGFEARNTLQPACMSLK